jgi:hypothetical protein
MANDFDLRDWIESSKQTRHGLKRGLLPLVALSIIVMVANRSAGLMMLFVTGVIAVAGFWVLASHIADWERQLALNHQRTRRAEPVTATRTATAAPARS